MRLHAIDDLRGKYIRLKGMSLHEYILVGGHVGGAHEANTWGTDQDGKRCHVWLQGTNYSVVDDGHCGHCGVRLCVPAVKHKCNPEKREIYYLRTVVSKWQDHFHKLGPPPIAETVAVMKDFRTQPGAAP